MFIGMNQLNEVLYFVDWVRAIIPEAPKREIVRDVALPRGGNTPA